MTPDIDETHSPELACWVESARSAETDFPIQNLPFGVFSRGAESKRIGVAIGDRILDLRRLSEAGLLGGLSDDSRQAAGQESLNELMALGREHWRPLRARLSELLSRDGEREATEKCLAPLAEVELALPAAIGDYTDFYASIFHATNIGSLFRPDNPLLPNYKWVPIGYHGRSSSIVPSGTPVRRPVGQRKPPDADVPTVGACRLLDYELEVGFFVGPGNELGEPIALERAEEHLFGLCLVNDWSARDLQAWEYQPLGPFLAKSFATSVSPFVVTLEALAPFRGAVFARDADDPQPLPYLAEGLDRERGGVDLRLEVWLESERMRAEGTGPMKLSSGSFLDMYWTLGQMLTHHASNGCSLRPGDLMASGTVSGPERSAYGALIEITERGKRPIELPTGESRAFLEDGDEVVLRGFCERDGFRRIGFGECRGRVLPSRA